MNASTAMREVSAYNTATASDNKIHNNSVARRFGFLGGLVPGGRDIRLHGAHAGGPLGPRMARERLGRLQFPEAGLRRGAGARRRRLRKAAL